MSDILIYSMHNSEKALVKKAIKISGLQIYIRNETFTQDGRICMGMFEIYTKNKRINTAPFWKVYDKLKKRKLLK